MELDRYELRQSGFLSRPAGIASLSLFVAATGITGQMILRDGPASSLAGIHSLAVVAAVLLMGSGLLACIALRRGPPPVRIELGREGISIPSRGASASRRVFAYRDLFSLRVWTRGRQSFLMLGIRGRLARSWRLADAHSRDEATRLLRSIRRRLEEEKGGLAQLAKMDRADAFAAAGGERPPSATLVMIGILTVCLAMEGITHSLGNPWELVRLGANAPMLVWNGEPWRLVTCSLLHFSVAHWAGNVGALLLLGMLLERPLGRVRLIAVVLGSPVGGAAASACAARAAILAGASTAVYGLMGSVIYLNVVRREELPAPHRLPAWFGILLLALEIVFSIVLPIDVAGHAGGLLTGVLLTATMIYAQPLSKLASVALVRSRALLGAFSLIFLFGVGAGLAHELSAGEGSIREYALRLAKSGAAAPSTLNNAAWRLATDPQSSAEDLATALDAANRAVRLAPDRPEVRDTLAYCDYRTGDFDNAIWIERRLTAERMERVFVSQLARFEMASVRREGVRRIGEGAAAGVQIAMVPVLPKEGGERAIEVTLAPHAFPEGAEIHAVAVRGPAVLGHLRLEVGGRVARTLRLVDPKSPHNKFGDDVAFEIVLVDTTTAHGGTDQWRWDFWAMEPEIAKLP